METLCFIEVVDHVLSQEDVDISGADPVVSHTVDALERCIRFESLLLSQLDSLFLNDLLVL